LESESSKLLLLESQLDEEQRQKGSIESQMKVLQARSQKLEEENEELKLLIEQ